MKVSKLNLLEAANAAEIEAGDIRFDYGGRVHETPGFGIVGSASDAAKFLIDVSTTAGYELAMQMASGMHQDTMGRQTIFYWPGLEITP